MLDLTDSFADATRAVLRNVPSADGAVTRMDNATPEIEQGVEIADPNKELKSAGEAMAEASTWLKTHPVITSTKENQDAEAFKKRTLIALQSARTERDGKTRPHNDALKEIRTLYDLVREKTQANRGGALQVVYDALKKRQTDYMLAIEAENARIAEEARQKAEAAEREAREAEAREREAIDDAAQGAEADIGTATMEADAAFADFQRANRQAAIAERGVTARVGSAYGRSSSMRNVRKLVVTDVVAAVKAIGPTEKLLTVVVQLAKTYEDMTGELPPGVQETFDRSM